jgi:hypothetical protein
MGVAKLSSQYNPTQGSERFHWHSNDWFLYEIFAKWALRHWQDVFVQQVLSSNSPVSPLS